MVSIAELIAQRDAIEQQIRELRESERQAAIARIREMAAEFDLTAEEVFGRKINRNKAAAKYRDPVTGRTWNGRGRAPRWLEGKNRDDFLIHKKPSA